ncbi:MAG: hypothetical protein KAT28_03935 [Candidatus Aenigmarchaeota archaeon]|nr:hypothetical protein [Candidatus Aenigmarchaeota archaeon]
MDVVVSAVLVLVLSLSVVGMVIQYGAPLIQEQKQEMDFEQGKNLVNYLSLTVSDLISEPINSSRVIELSLRKGKIEFLDNKISFYLGYQEYNKEFSKVIFSEIDILIGETKVRLTKKLKDEIEVELIG